MKKGLAVAMAALLGVATMGTTAMAAAYYNLFQRGRFRYKRCIH